MVSDRAFRIEEISRRQTAACNLDTNRSVVNAVGQARAVRRQVYRDTRIAELRPASVRTETAETADLSADRLCAGRNASRILQNTIPESPAVVRRSWQTRRRWSPEFVFSTDSALASSRLIRSRSSWKASPLPTISRAAPDAKSETGFESGEKSSGVHRPSSHRIPELFMT